MNSGLVFGCLIEGNNSGLFSKIRNDWNFMEIILLNLSGHLIDVIDVIELFLWNDRKRSSTDDSVFLSPIFSVVKHLFEQDDARIKCNISQLEIVCAPLSLPKQRLPKIFFQKLLWGPRRSNIRNFCCNCPQPTKFLGKYLFGTTRLPVYVQNWPNMLFSALFGCLVEKLSQSTGLPWKTLTP